jgi:PTS system mannose-specific IIA component
MIGILILAQRDFGKGLIAAVEHVLGQRPPGLEALPVDYDQAPDQLASVVEKYIARLDQRDGVLILADIYGATHTNAACRSVRKGHVELIAGVNLPMLIRVLNYRDLDLAHLIEKALTANGIMCAPEACAVAEVRR